jgi:hypothetical protein
MTRRDRLFVLAVVGLTALFPLPLALLRPTAEERAVLGTLAGWGLALLIMVPSYALLVRAMAESNPHRFVSAFMTGAMLRLFLTAGGVFGFWLAVKPAPMRSFVLSLLGGYVLLSAVELTLVRPPRRASPGSAP